MGTYYVTHTGLKLEILLSYLSAGITGIYQQTHLAEYFFFSLCTTGV
jgi:hypothetical protein